MYIVLYLGFWSLEVIYLLVCKCNIIILLQKKNRSLLTGGSSTHTTSAGARMGIGRFVNIFFNALGACQTSYDVRPGTVRCPVGHRLNRTIKLLNKNCPMCANADRASSGHRTVPGRCHFSLSNPTKRRTGAVEFLLVPKLHRAPYDVLKMFKKRTILPVAGRAPYGRRRIVRCLVK